MKGLQLVKKDEKNGSVLEQTFFGYPAKRQMRLYASGVLQVQHVAHFTDGLQCSVKYFPGMGGRNAEACSGFNDGCCRETDNHRANVSLYHLPAKCPDFSRHIKHQGNDRGVIVAVDDEAHLAESSAEVGGVF